MAIEILGTRTVEELNTAQSLSGSQLLLVYDGDSNISYKVRTDSFLGKAFALTNFSAGGIPYSGSSGFSNLIIGTGLSLSTSASQLSVSGVPYSSLASITGYSVLGKATTGSGTPTAITSTVANQVLVSSSSGSIAFGYISNSNLAAGTAIANIKMGSETISGSYIAQDAKIVAATLGSNSVITTKILDKNVTFAKIQDVTANRLLGRNSSTPGSPEPITVGGGLSISTSGSMSVNHASIYGAVADEHINHSSFTITGTNYLSGGGNLKTTSTIDINSSKRTSTYSATGDKVALTGSDGYLNAMVKDLIYIQLIPRAEAITASTWDAPNGVFWIPASYSSKSIKKFGIGSWSAIGTGGTVTVGITSSVSSSDLTTLSITAGQYTNESGALSISCTGISRLQFYVKVANPVGATGLDAWIELG